MKPKYTRFVHEFIDKHGDIRYAVAAWDEKHGNWYAPLDARTYKLTGCSQEFARTLSGMGGYKTRKQALRRARYLFAYEVETDEGN